MAPVAEGLRHLSTWRSCFFASSLPKSRRQGFGPGVIVEELAARTTEARNYLSTIAAELWGRGVRVQRRVRTGTPVELARSIA